MTLREEILAMLSKHKSAPTTQTIHNQAKLKRWGGAEVDAALSALVASGELRCVNGLWVRTDRLMVDNRKPRGPKKLDPKSAEARTLPLEFYGERKC